MIDPVKEVLDELAGGYGKNEDGTPWKVEDYLNNMDYKPDPLYTPSVFALMFVNFIKLVNGAQGEENKTPVVHYRMLDTITRGGTRIINLCHRGIAKTTVMGEYLFLFIGVYGDIPGFGKVPLALYVSDSIENGVKNMRKNLEFRYENSDFLKEFIPEARFTDIRWEFKNKEDNKFVVKGYGAKTGVRGAKEMGTRPVLAVLDDLISDEDARSATVISAVEDTVYKAVNYALHPKHNMIIWSGTPFNAKDPLYKAVESGAWSVNVFPVCEQYPCTEEEFCGSWPDRFPYKYVKKQYDDAVKLGKVDTFNQELMLRICLRKIDSFRMARFAGINGIRFFRIRVDSTSILLLTLLRVISKPVTSVLSLYGQLTTTKISSGLMVWLSVRIWEITFTGYLPWLPNINQWQ